MTSDDVMMEEMMMSTPIKRLDTPRLCVIMHVLKIMN